LNEGTITVTREHYERLKNERVALFGANNGVWTDVELEDHCINSSKKIVTSSHIWRILRRCKEIRCDRSVMEGEGIVKVSETMLHRKMPELGCVDRIDKVWEAQR